MTKRSSISVILTLLMTLVVYTTCQTVRQAVVKMQPTAASSYNVQGTLVLEEFENGENRISGVLSGMPEGSYGFHIHMFGDISSDQGTATGSHFNPNNAPHSNNLSDMNRHVGDMGNIAFNSSQIAVVDLTDQLWTLHGNQSVVGRSVIIHSIEDTGGSSYGARYAQGVIGIKFVSSGTTNAAMNDEPGSSSTFAVCELTGAFTGRVVFSEDTSDNTMAITAKICGLSDGYHGIHVHTYGDLSGGFDLAGGHYNPTSVAHGLPSDSVKHFGDIGNIYSFNGTADFSGEFTQLTTMGSNSLFGRSIVIHQDKDWGKEYQSAGNSGTRVAMCVIGVQNSLKSVDDVTCEPLEYVEMAVVQLVKTTQTNNDIQGTLHFSKGSDGQYRVNGTITGLAANSVHGLHIHQYGDLSSADGSATGGHYNPYNAPHSNDLSDMNRHLGDMGNITSDDNGVAHVDIDQVLWTLNGPDSIVGRAVILHEKVDDGNATANGNAGKRYAQGVIGVKNVPMNLARGNQVNKMYAAAEIVGTSIRGRITFSQATESSRVTVNIKVCGLGVGPHGIHVHEFGDVSAGIDSVGGHYNPEGNPHRYPDNPDRHVGDMGNITATAYGAEATFTIDKLTLYGEHSILGRAVIVHSGADQGVSQQPAGASGTKVAVGIIGTTASEVSLASIECEDPVFSSSPVADSSDDSASMPSARVSLLALVLMAFATLLAISL